MDLWAFGTLIIAALGLGVAGLSALRIPREDAVSFVALAATAGLGMTAVALGIFALFSALQAARFLIPAGALVTVIWIARGSLHWSRPPLRRPSLGMTLLIKMVAAACVGSIAPMTDIDSLDYPIPIAQHLTRDGEWRFGPVRRCPPIRCRKNYSQPSWMLEENSLALLSGIETVLVAVLLWSLAGRFA